MKEERTNQDGRRAGERQVVEGEERTIEEYEKYENDKDNGEQDQGR